MTSVKDPICGMQVDPERAVERTDYEGKIYFFCCAGCKTKFDAVPSQYTGVKSQNLVSLTSLANAGAATSPRTQRTVVEYTCPMHPEVRQFGPGACPKCGMALEPLQVSSEETNPELAEMKRRFWISAALTLPILVLMLCEFTGQRAMSPATPWIQLAFATPVVVWGGFPFFQRSWASIINRHLNMFTLIALGPGAAYAFSVAAVLFPSIIPASFHNPGDDLPLYFEPAAVITTLVLLGQILDCGHAARPAGR